MSDLAFKISRILSKAYKIRKKRFSIFINLKPDKKYRIRL